ncbi:hypothetical protein E2C01_074039 [Portunus trituberculatus]|uniref:Uncharacterized protein n=1 Tax=Portunus trituberculatus TaxID=210409 RepID=A0A5B7I4I8_PORTR|nr:hypothetical protein [Portunus trituberculatus]
MCQGHVHLGEVCRVAQQVVLLMSVACCCMEWMVLHAATAHYAVQVYNCVLRDFLSMKVPCSNIPFLAFTTITLPDPPSQAE